MLKTTCHPLNSETARSMYSTGWGMLAAPYLMAASGDVNVVALVSMLAVLRWNPCRVWARRRDVRETRVLRWLRDGERRPLAFWGAGGDGMRKRSASRRKGSRKNFGLSGIQGPRRRRESRSKGRAQIWRGER